MLKTFSVGLMLLLAHSAFAKPLRIAIIDTGLNLSDPRFAPYLCKTGHKDFTGEGIEDTMGHGTHIAGLIASVAGRGEYCLVIYKYYSDHETDRWQNGDREYAAIKEATETHVDIINVSGGGYEFGEEEQLALQKHPETLLIGAAGNDHREQRYYPCGYVIKNTVCVGALTADGNRVASSNYGKYVDVWEYGENVKSTLPDGKLGFMTGTSQATAIHTGKVIKEKLSKAHRRAR